MELIDLLGDLGKLAGVGELLREVNPPAPGGWVTLKSGRRIQLGQYSPHTKRATLKITAHKVSKAKPYKSKVFKTKAPKTNKNPKYKYRVKKASTRDPKRDVLWSHVLAARTVTLKKRNERAELSGDVLVEGWITKDGRRILIGGASVSAGKDNPTSIQRNGWITKSGEFHENKSDDETHSESAVRLGLGSEGGPEFGHDEAISNGNIRVAHISLKGENVTIFTAYTGNANTKKILSKAIDSIRGGKVTIEYLKDGRDSKKASYTGVVTPDQARTFLSTGNLPSKVAQFHSEQTFVEALREAFGLDEKPPLRGKINKASRSKGGHDKAKEALSERAAKIKEADSRHLARLSESGQNQELGDDFMNEQIVMLMNLAEAAGQLVWITKNGYRIPIGGQTTTAQKFRSSSGKWTPERASLHQQVADRMVAGKMAPVGRKPIAYILGGGTASGKTTVSRQLIGEDPNIVRIDPDELKLPIPEYAQLKISDPTNAAHLVHDESKQITQEVLGKTIANGLDLTYDSTTSGAAGPALIHKLAENGYDVRAIFVDIPVNMAIQRSELRSTSSLDPMNIGRVVPEGIIRTSHKGAADNFFLLKNDPALTQIRMYDNTEFGKPPRLIYSRTNGNGSLGQEKIYDQARYNKYSRKSVGLAEASKKVRFIRPGCLPNARGYFDAGQDHSTGESEAGDREAIAELILETEELLERVKSSLQVLTD